MKHPFQATFFLIAIFIFAQIMGLAIINEYVDIEKSSETGQPVINEDVYDHSIGGRPPEVDNYYLTAAYIFIAVLLGTGMLLLLIKFKLGRFMKLWFFIAIMFCLGKAFSPFILMINRAWIPEIVAYSGTIAIVIAGIFAFFKLFKTNIYVHNFTEVFIYGGLAAFVVPILNIAAAAFMLVGISAYDMYAVWKSRHMVKMAKFQSQQKMFAGLLIPYKKDTGMPIFSQDSQESKKTAKKIAEKKTKAPADDNVKTAILGGGDIAFPLIFSGALLWQTGSFFYAFIVTLFTTIALSLLLYKGKKDRFYPAMPFISAGCFLGFIAVKLLAFIGL